MISTFPTGLCLQEFNRRVLEGFQVTPLWNQGFICDDGRYVVLCFVLFLFCCVGDVLNQLYSGNTITPTASGIYFDKLYCNCVPIHAL